MAKKRAGASVARKPPRTTRRGSAAIIPRHQWRLPAGYHRAGERFATLRHVVDPDTPTVDGDDLSDQQRTELTVERIKRQKRFKMGVLGSGLVDKQRALEEVRKRTAIGLALIDVEHRAIRLLREYLAQHSATRIPAQSRRPRPTSRKPRKPKVRATRSRMRSTTRRRSDVAKKKR